MKAVKIARDADSGAVAPSLATVIDADYPLAEPLLLFRHPDSPAAAAAFCEFAVGPEGAQIAARHGLITPWAQRQYEGNKRLAEMKAGKGVRVSAGPFPCRRATHEPGLSSRSQTGRCSRGAAA